MTKVLELLQQRECLYIKKVKFSRQYSKWVKNAWFNVLVWWGIGSLFKEVIQESKMEKWWELLNLSFLGLWLLGYVFIIYKILAFASLSKKIQKLSQKIAEIDRQIAEKLSKSNF